MQHMGNVHYLVTNICDVYYQRMRLQVYFTPKSYLSYPGAYKKLYIIKSKGVGPSGVKLQDRSQED